MRRFRVRFWGVVGAFAGLAGRREFRADLRLEKPGIQRPIMFLMFDLGVQKARENAINPRSPHS